MTLYHEQQTSTVTVSKTRAQKATMNNQTSTVTVSKTRAQKARDTIP